MVYRIFGNGEDKNLQNFFAKCFADIKNCTNFAVA